MPPSQGLRFVLRAAFAAGFLVASAWATVRAESPWPRFRGPNGSGLYAGTAPLPERIGPEANVVWKHDLPPGLSSPVVAAGRVHLTAMRPERRLVVLGLSVADGRILWESEAPVEHPEPAPDRWATPSCAADGTCVVSLFGAAGLFCHEPDGRLRWHRSIGRLTNRFGTCQSPLIAGRLVVIVVDHDGASFVAAYDKQTGEPAWRTERLLFGRNYGSPIEVRRGDRPQILTAGSGLVATYDLATGTPTSWVRGAAAVANPTPVVGPDGTVYAVGEAPAKGFQGTPFADLLAARDADGNGRLERSEVPASIVRERFAEFDADGSGDLSEREYAKLSQSGEPFESGLLAHKAGAQEVAWQSKKSMPRTPSPLFHEGILYLVSESGVLQSLDPATGEPIRLARITASGPVWSSPVLGDGKIYVCSNRGTVTVVRAGREWEEIGTAELPGEIQTTPALADGRVYIRTDAALWCFGTTGSGSK